MTCRGASEKPRRRICLINSAGKVITHNESTETIPDELLSIILSLAHSLILSASLLVKCLCQFDSKSKKCNNAICISTLAVPNTFGRWLRFHRRNPRN